MKKRCFVAVVYVLAAIIAPATVAADQAHVSHFRGQSALADFTRSESACIVTNASVLVLKQETHTPPGPGSSVSSVNIFIFRSDICAGEKPVPLLAASGGAPLSDQNFVVDKKLNSASLNLTVRVCDAAKPSTCFDVLIDLTWRATGPLIRDSAQIRFESPTCTITGHVNSTVRDVVVSGSISGAATDFAAEADAIAQLMQVQSGHVVIKGEQCGDPGGHPGD